MREHLLYGERLMPFEEGVKAQLSWLMQPAGKRTSQRADLAIEFAGPARQQAAKSERD